MSCKKVRLKHRQEQDYWLSFVPELSATEEERLEFLRFDSHGGQISLMNPILRGKKAHGIKGGTLLEEYFALDGSWPGGLWLVADYLSRPFDVRPLREWFGDEAVQRWEEAYWDAKRSGLLVA